MAPKDFFCYVTKELLLTLHLTACCGNYLSKRAVRRLKQERKPFQQILANAAAVVPGDVLVGTAIPSNRCCQGNQHRQRHSM